MKARRSENDIYGSMIDDVTIDVPMSQLMHRSIDVTIETSIVRSSIIIDHRFLDGFGSASALGP